MLKLINLIVISVLLQTCSDNVTNGIDVDENTVQLEVLQTGAKFTALSLVINTDVKKKFILKENDIEIGRGTFAGNDTLIFSDSLKPATDYSYKAEFIYKGKNVATSRSVDIITMPLSSGNFIWRVDTVSVFPGDARDLAVIDGNSVWAVGQFPRNDNEWRDPNAIKWNGEGYEYFLLPTLSSNGKDTLISSPLQTLVAFAGDDIWVFSSGNRYSYYDGNQWHPGFLPWEKTEGSIKKAWGFSSDDFYLIGSDGSITHYDGNAFTLMDTPTDADLFDIHGYMNPENGEKSVWVTSGGYPNGTATIMKLVNNEWKIVWDIEKPLNDTFFYPHNINVPDGRLVIFTVWSGLHQKTRLYLADQKNIQNHIVLGEGNTWSTDLAYTLNNNIFITGSFGNIEHYNGNALIQVYTTNSENSAIETKNDKIFAIGRIGFQQVGFVHGIQN